MTGMWASSALLTPRTAALSSAPQRARDSGIGFHTPVHLRTCNPQEVARRIVDLFAKAAAPHNSIQSIAEVLQFVQTFAHCFRFPDAVSPQQISTHGTPRSVCSLWR